jgi:hypothetical protein
MSLLFIDCLLIMSFHKIFMGLKTYIYIYFIDNYWFGSLLFWNVTQRRLVEFYRRFGSTRRFHMIGMIRCAETLVITYQS